MSGSSLQPVCNRRAARVSSSNTAIIAFRNCCISYAGALLQDSAMSESNSRPPFGYQDALDEALVAVEQIVIPRQQPIELLPQTAELLEVQVSPCRLRHSKVCPAIPFTNRHAVWLSVCLQSFVMQRMASASAALTDETCISAVPLCKQEQLVLVVCYVQRQAMPTAGNCILLFPFCSQ